MQAASFLPGRSPDLPELLFLVVAAGILWLMRLLFGRGTLVGLFGRSTGTPQAGMPRSRLPSEASLSWAGQFDQLCLNLVLVRKWREVSMGWSP